MAAAGLSDAQIEEFREAFHLFDRNQDGTITSSNLANVLKVGIEFISGYDGGDSLTPNTYISKYKLCCYKISSKIRIEFN